MNEALDFMAFNFAKPYVQFLKELYEGDEGLATFEVRKRKTYSILLNGNLKWTAVWFQSLEELSVFFKLEFY